MENAPINEDLEVLRKLKLGDVGAFNSIYEKYKRPLTSNIFRMVKSKELATDLAQDLFIKVWANHANIDIEKPFRAYLNTIARNLITDQFRKATRDSLALEQLATKATELYQHIEEDLIQKEEYNQLYQSINKLPEQCRRVFLLHKFDGKSYKEISELIGISTSTVRGHIVRAGKFLKDDLNPEILQIALIAAAIIYSI